MSPAFRLFYHIGILSLAVIWAFVWLRTPSLSHYSLQLFAVTIVAYFSLKRLNQAEFWQLLPSPISLEMAVATLAFLLIIGATGNIHSPLFPLSFVHLFFLVISAESATAIIVMMEILLFHYSLTPHMGVLELSYLSSLPIVMTFFLIAKDQFYRVSRQQKALDQKTAAIRKLQRFDATLEKFIIQSLGMRVPEEHEPQTVNTPITTTQLLEPMIELDLMQAEIAAEAAEAEKIATEITETLESISHDQTSSTKV